MKDSIKNKNSKKDLKSNKWRFKYKIRGQSNKRFDELNNMLPSTDDHAYYLQLDSEPSDFIDFRKPFLDFIIFNRYPLEKFFRIQFSDLENRISDIALMRSYMVDFFKIKPKDLDWYDIDTGCGLHYTSPNFILMDRVKEVKYEMDNLLGSQVPVRLYDFAREHQEFEQFLKIFKSEINLEDVDQFEAFLKGFLPTRKIPFKGSISLITYLFIIATTKDLLKIPGTNVRYLINNFFRDHNGHDFNEKTLDARYSKFLNAKRSDNLSWLKANHHELFLFVNRGFNITIL